MAGWRRWWALSSRLKAMLNRRKTPKIGGIPLQAADPSAEKREPCLAGWLIRRTLLRPLNYSSILKATAASKVCTISCQVRTRAFARAVLGAAVGNHTEAIASAQALAINRHLDVTCIKSNKRELNSFWRTSSSLVLMGAMYTLLEKGILLKLGFGGFGFCFVCFFFVFPETHTNCFILSYVPSWEGTIY